MSSLVHNAKPKVTAAEVCDRARRLGYIKLAYQGPLMGIWEELCYDQAIPCIMLYPQGNYWRLVWWSFPYDPYVLKPEAADVLQRQADASRSPKARGICYMGAGSGDVSGLLPDKAEALAFALTEALYDPANLLNTEG